MQFSPRRRSNRLLDDVDGTIYEEPTAIDELRSKLAKALGSARRPSSRREQPPFKERSQSRGREPFTSVGRGGAGNIIRSDSVSRDRVADERGRELSPSHPDRITSSGRGGAGNIRSPSQDPAAAAAAAKELEYERAVLEARAQDTHTTTGRGGRGNIRLSSPARSGSVDSNSRSRDRNGHFVSSVRSGLHHSFEEESPAYSHDNSTYDDAHRGNETIPSDDRRGRSEVKHASGLGGVIGKITGHPSS